MGALQRMVKQLRRMQLLRLLLACAVLALPGALHAQRLSPQTLVDLRVVEDVALSPDGKRVLYRIDRRRAQDEPLGGGVGELWSVAVAGGAPLRFVAHGIDQRTPQWSQDGDRIAWLARSQLGEPLQIQMARADGSSVATLTDVPGGVRAFQWSSDGMLIAFTAADAPSVADQTAQRLGRDWIVASAMPAQVRLYVLDLRSKAVMRLTRENLSVGFFAWSPDGTRFVVGAAPSSGDDDSLLRMQLYLIGAAGGSLESIAPTVGMVADPVWSQDGKWIAWLASTAIHDPYAGSVFVAPAGRDAAPRNVSAGFIGTATRLSAMPGQPATFLFRSEEWQATVLRTVNAQSGEMGTLNSAAQIVTGAVSFERTGRTFAVAASAPGHPPEVFTGVTSRPAVLRRVTHSNPQLDAVELGAQEIARWRSVDGTPIEGVLIKPPGFKAGNRYPVILHVHGGSESVVSNGWQGSSINWGQVLAARGYVVLFPNYRGSRGRGVEFVAGNRRDVMGREWEDIERGLDHLIEAGIADGERAGIYGFSWGGYAAGWGATHASHRFKAAVGGAGIYDWISEAGTNATRMHEQLAHWDLPLYENFLLYLARSPLYEIRRANTPMLLLHGAEDSSCPVGQAVEFHTALKWRGVPTELVVYPREGHGMVEYEHQLDFVARGLAWLDRYLRP